MVTQMEAGEVRTTAVGIGPDGEILPADGPAPDEDGTAAVHYWFPVQVEVLQAAPIDHDELVDRTLQRLAEGVEGA